MLKITQSQQMEEYSRMHADRSFNDVEIKSASEDETIPAHKVVLATASSTLRKMLLSEMVEAKTSKINIKASFDSTKVFVKYMYTYDDSELTFVSDFMLVELYHLSNFYDVVRLEQNCRNRMESKLKLSNLTEFLFIAEKYKIKTLMTKCLKIIDENALQLMRTDSWNRFLCFRPRLTKLLRETPPTSAVSTSKWYNPNASSLKLNVDCSAQIINFLLFDEDGLLKSCPIAELGMADSEEQASES